ncbi:unnamed protein product, partial [Symbiodinium pilosum]
ARLSIAERRIQAPPEYTLLMQLEDNAELINQYEEVLAHLEAEEAAAPMLSRLCLPLTRNWQAFKRTFWPPAGEIEFEC